MAKIRILPDPLVAKIAAGEVVERPASVVKELVENALDSGAASIRIKLLKGGKEGVSVADDGAGMSAEDAVLAFGRHATSKIASLDDLEQVGTLGFRGEGLAAIAAVSRTELLTAETDGEGWRVRVEGGRLQGPEPVARARGTRLDVASLFFNVPARRKFLKTEQTELRRCVEVVQGYALAKPGVRFRLEHADRELFDFPSAPSERERIAQVFGEELAGSLVPIPAAGGWQESIWGFVGDPSTARRRRHFLFANRRLIRDRSLMAIFYRAVRDEWRNDDFPALFLYVDVPPQEVDVNIHPQKTEVRFRDGRLLGRVAEALHRALRAALGEVSAEVRPSFDMGDVPFRWQGLGGKVAGRDEVAGEVRDAGPATDKISQPVFAPLQRAPVPLSGRADAPSSLRLLGQYKASILLLEGPDGLYLIDQHVAHERILYERLRSCVSAERPDMQRLLEPVVLELSAAEKMRLESISEVLEECGFSLALLSGGSVAVDGIPAPLTTVEAERLLTRLAAQSDDAADSAVEVKNRVLDSFTASMACRRAVKMHDPLTPKELEHMLDELFRSEQPFVCPHGRPVVLRIGDGELEKKFERR